MTPLQSSGRESKEPGKVPFLPVALPNRQTEPFVNYYNTYTRTFLEKEPRDDVWDFAVKLRATNLRRGREKLEELRSIDLNRSDGFLAVSTSALSAVAGAMVTGARLSAIGIIFLLTGVVFLVLYFSNRKHHKVSVQSIVRDLENIIPDPDRDVM